MRMFSELSNQNTHSSVSRHGASLIHAAVALLQEFLITKRPKQQMMHFRHEAEKCATEKVSSAVSSYKNR